MKDPLLALRIIRDMCDAPYWETKRRDKIREIAQAALRAAEPLPPPKKTIETSPEGAFGYQ